LSCMYLETKAEYGSVANVLQLYSADPRRVSVPGQMGAVG